MATVTENGVTVTVDETHVHVTLETGEEFSVERPPSPPFPWGVFFKWAGMQALATVVGGLLFILIIQFVMWAAS